MGAAGVAQAFLLAAGLGTRLRPLSRVVPKPVWPLFDVPLAARVLDLLASAGVGRAVVNLHYLPEVLQGRLEPWVPQGLELAWSREARILGTGGALVPWKDALAGGPFFLANADTYQEIDLRALARFHRQRGALATLSVAPVAPGRSAPLELAPDGRIVRFLGARAPGARAGRPCEFTGLHLLEPEILAEVPDGPCCINADVHQSLVGRGAPVYGFELEQGAFWSDLGTPGRYLAAHRRLLDLGRLSAAPGEVVDGPAGPWYRGRGAQIAEGVRIGPGTVVGAGARIEAGARLRSCVVWPGARCAGAEDAVVPDQGPVLAAGLETRN